MNSGGFVSLPIQTFEIVLVKSETEKTIIYTSTRKGTQGSSLKLNFQLCKDVVSATALNWSWLQDSIHRLDLDASPGLLNNLSLTLCFFCSFHLSTVISKPCCFLLSSPPTHLGPSFLLSKTVLSGLLSLPNFFGKSHSQFCQTPVLATALIPCVSSTPISQSPLLAG